MPALIEFLLINGGIGAIIIIGCYGTIYYYTRYKNPLEEPLLPTTSTVETVI